MRYGFGWFAERLTGFVDGKALFEKSEDFLRGAIARRTGDCGTVARCAGVCRAGICGAGSLGVAIAPSDLNRVASDFDCSCSRFHGFVESTLLRIRRS